MTAAWKNRNFISFKTGKLFSLLGSLLITLFLSSCASDKEGSIKPLVSEVKDPVVFKIEGVDGHLSDNIQAYMNTLPKISKKRSMMFSREVRDETSKALTALGYYNSKVEVKLPDFKNEQDRTMVISVDAGKPMFIRNCSINIVGEGAYFSSFDRLIKDSGIKTYAIINHSSYDKLKSDLLTNARVLGFFDARYLSSVIMVYPEENAADVFLTLDTGRRYKFGDLIADEKTRKLLHPSESVLTFKSGDYYTQKALTQTQTALMQTGFYKSIDLSPDLDKKQDYTVPVNLDLERQSYNLMRTGVGFSTDEGPRILLGWDKPLLNDYGHSFSSYARLSMVKQDAQAIYKIPHRNTNLNYFYIKLAQIYTDLNDTESRTSHASFHYVDNFHKKWRRDYYLALEYEDYEQSKERDYPLNLMPGILLSRRESSGGIDPHTGYSLSFDLTGASECITDQSFVRLVTTLKGIFSPQDDTRVVYRLQGGAIAGPDSRHMPASLRFFAGGDQSVRGFGYLDESPRDKSGGLIGGRYMATGTLEYQFPIGIDSSRMAVFADVGTVFNDAYESKNNMLYGPGIGYRYLSKYGIFKIDLAAGFSDRDKNVKLHFSFGPEF